MDIGSWLSINAEFLPDLPRRLDHDLEFGLSLLHGAGVDATPRLAAPCCEAISRYVYVDDEARIALSASKASAQT